MRPYFSERKAGYTDHMPLPTEAMARFTLHEYVQVDQEGYFQTAFGKHCVDLGDIPGEAATGIAEGLAVRFGEQKANRLLPSWQNWQALTVDDLFDVLEYLHDHVAKPTNVDPHDYNLCGEHVIEADPEAGRLEWQGRLNPYLEQMEPPCRFTSDGRIEHVPEDAGMKELVDEPVAFGDDEIDARIRGACRAFFARGATIGSQRQAIRDLADVLERLRPALREMLFDRDDGDLFNIANNFAFRHLNQKQKTKYDRALFFPWIFHMYLATIHLAARAKDRGLASASVN